ncbi:hypothetical protein [Spirosoma montaniterrae]|uniref:Outer membrane protein beta-barrel domain-containing protein n=1 Tax=Spirosoma montaniterrae TaxID=1178516 RepID=A0A1P9X387_9BACT|nr:hypothetical protein [Spirosoma montaniterrae]AQG82094.1 hypothetical protein AWR27_24025 [Spirosoma montaniterrae]
MNGFRRIAAVGIGLVCIAMAAQANPADSLVIRFANKTRMVIYAPDKAGIQALSNYDLNKIVREMSMQLDSVPGGKTAISRDGDNYLRDTVLVMTKNKDGVRIVVKSSSDSTHSDTVQVKQEYKRESKRRSIGSWSRSIDFQIGFNTWLNSPNAPLCVACQTDPTANRPDLSPLGSRYFAVAFSQRPTLINGKRAKLSLYFAAEASWNNFMFQEDVRVEKGINYTQFVPFPEPLRRSKLTTFAAQLPVVPRVSFYNAAGRRVFHIGVGGFIGYRLDSYSKIRRADGGRDRRHSNFYLNDLRYGLVMHLGILRTNLFAKYDLNPIFQTQRGPDVRALSFGITF